MHLISKKILKEFWEKHPNSRTNLQTWYKHIKKYEFENFPELRSVFPSADIVENFTVFNITGNNYRLIALVDYQYKKVFVRYILTHADYDTNTWKNDLWYT